MGKRREKLYKELIQDVIKSFRNNHMNEAADFLEKVAEEIEAS